MTNKDKSKRRRWFQFSLRTVLVLTAATAVIVAIYRPEPPRGRPLNDGWSIFEQTSEEAGTGLGLNQSTSSLHVRTRGGRFIVRDETGRKRVDGRFDNNAATGRWTVYDARGRVLLRGEAEQHVPSGEWTGWHGNGRKAVSISFRQPDLREAKAGSRTLKVPYAPPVREGAASIWHSRGGLSGRGQHQEDRRAGIWEIRDHDGATQRVAYRSGLQHDSNAKRFLGHNIDWAELLKKVQADLDSDDQQRHAAALAIAPYLDEAGVAMLTRRLETSDKALTLLLLRSLGGLGTQAIAAEDSVAAHATSSDEDIAISAMLTLASIGADRKSNLQQLVSRLIELPDRKRFRFVIQASSLDEHAVPVLERMLSTDNRQQRRCVFQILVAMLDATQQTSTRLECQAAIVAALQRVEAGADAELAEAAKAVLADYPNWEFRHTREPVGALLPVVG